MFLDLVGTEQGLQVRGTEMKGKGEVVHGPVDQFSIRYPEVLQLSGDIEKGRYTAAAVWHRRQWPGYAEPGLAGGTARVRLAKASAEMKRLAKAQIERILTLLRRKA